MGIALLLKHPDAEMHRGVFICNKRTIPAFGQDKACKSRGLNYFSFDVKMKGGGIPYILHFIVSMTVGKIGEECIRKGYVSDND